jgi:3-dehydroquinate synthase
MKKINFKFSHSSVDYYFDTKFSALRTLVDKRNAVVITDENVFSSHTSKFKGWNTIVLKSGEETKVQATVDGIVKHLISIEADRQTVLVGVGGGVITDITGYVGSVYMRGINFGFVPTSLLAMVDASIGGKNGIDVGVFKNLVGVVRQPSFLLYDINFLTTLPSQEWANGFAEVIKHACIKDATMFNFLEKHDGVSIQKNREKLTGIIKKNAVLKSRAVQRDEFEKGERRLLNFGHTLGHALENQYEISHGQAISIGMCYASIVSQKLTGFKDAQKVIALLTKYNLPVDLEFDMNEVFDVLKMDKKKSGGEINYIVLEKIGKGSVRRLPFRQLKKLLNDS